VDVLEALRSVGIVALPIHDAVVVRDDNSDKAKAVMKQVFREHTGITPDVSLG
jgi:cellulose synthase/poly-beta-1,6-N-acetylglucosamine synthase-like glycosyltransferase